MLKFRNNLSGLHAPGYRFRFRGQSIAHRALYLPRPMRQDPLVVRLINGEHPCHVFNTPDIHNARKAFNSLRCRYDFPFWAATAFPVRHIDAPDIITLLDLNEDQHKIADQLLKTYEDKQFSRFIITKTGKSRGVSTCVQAYIIWLQLFQTPLNSQTCGLSGSHLGRFKENIARFLGKDSIDYCRYKFQICDRYTSAFFNTFNRPDSLRGIDFGYVHLVDMHKWKDPDTNRSSRALCAAQSGILLDYRTIIIIEGNNPSPKFNPVFYSQLQFAEENPENSLFRHIRLLDPDEFISSPHLLCKIRGDNLSHVVTLQAEIGSKASPLIPVDVSDPLR